MHRVGDYGTATLACGCQSKLHCRYLCTLHTPFTYGMTQMHWSHAAAYVQCHRRQHHRGQVLYQKWNMLMLLWKITASCWPYTVFQAPPSAWLAALALLLAPSLAAPHLPSTLATPLAQHFHWQSALWRQHGKQVKVHTAHQNYSLHHTCKSMQLHLGRHCHFDYRMLAPSYGHGVKLILCCTVCEYLPVWHCVVTQQLHYQCEWYAASRVVKLCRRQLSNSSQHQEHREKRTSASSATLSFSMAWLLPSSSTRVLILASFSFSWSRMPPRDCSSSSVSAVTYTAGSHQCSSKLMYQPQIL